MPFAPMRIFCKIYRDNWQRILMIQGVVELVGLPIGIRIMEPRHYLKCEVGRKCKK